jgi:hypothetical protein
VYLAGRSALDLHDLRHSRRPNPTWLELRRCELLQWHDHIAAI